MDISSEIAELKEEIKALKKRITVLEHDVDPKDIVYGPGPGPRKFDFNFGDGWDEPISPGPGRHGEW